MRKFPARVVAMVLLALSGTGAQAAETLFLKGNGYYVRIDPATGAVSSAGGASRGEQPCVIGSVDVYQTIGETGDKVTAQETDDQVTRIDRPSPRRVTLTCRNLKLPDLTIVKDYTLDDKGVLAKKVQWNSRRPTTYYLKVSARTTLSRPFLKDSYFFQLKPIHIEGEAGRALLPADAGGTENLCHTVVAVNRQHNQTVGQYVYRNNGRYVYAPMRDWGRLADNFWQINNVYEDFIRADGDHSYETHLVLGNKGDAMDFYGKYKQLPEYLALRRDQRDPDWVDRVLFASDLAFADYGYDKNAPGYTEDFWGMKVTAEHYRQLLDPNLDQYITQVNFSWAMYPGFVPWQGMFAVGPDERGGVHDPAFIRKGLEVTGQVSPQIKRALYYWRATIDETLEPFKRHPEWFAYDRHGKKYKGSFAEGSHVFHDFLPNLNHRDYMAFQKTQVEHLTKTYGAEFLYLDGGNEMIGYADWRSNRFIQGYQFIDYSKMMRQSKAGQEFAVFMNAPNAPYGSMYYWEGCGLWQTEIRKNWRSVGERMLVAKIMQYGNRWTAPLSWSWAEDGDPYYANYLVGLGFKPARIGIPPLPQIRYPYMQAAFEMRHLQVKDAMFAPCFWRGDATSVEAYCVGQDSFAALSLISHEKNPAKVRASIPCLKELGLPAGGPIFLWQVDLADPREYPKDLYRRLADLWKQKKVSQDPSLVQAWRTRRVCRVAPLGEIPNGQPSLEREITLRPQLLTMLILTRVPAVFVAMGDQKVQMNTPSVGDGVLQGQIDLASRRATLTAHCRQKARIALAAPQGLTVNEAKVNRDTVQTEAINLDGRAMPTVDIPAGESKIEIQYR